MDGNEVKSDHTKEGPEAAGRWFRLFAVHSFSLIISGALFCTLAVKFYIANRVGRLDEYIGWIWADIAVLLGIECLLSVVCFLSRRKWVLRAVLCIAAVVCTWSVVNAGWLIATGTQVLPAVLVPVVRDPLNALLIIGVNLWYRPAAAVILLAPSAVALAFFFTVLARPLRQEQNNRVFLERTVVSAAFIFVALLAGTSTARNSSGSAISEELRYNCQLKAIESLFGSSKNQKLRIDSANITRKVPAFDEIRVSLPHQRRAADYNVVVLVLEGIQYRQTLLCGAESSPSPYLVSLARQGVEFTNARCTVSHTTKALFSCLTGRLPSISQDIVEAIPAEKQYASLAKTLKSRLNYGTAFFQSAKGDFECRPGLVHNLGFEKFWARDDLKDPAAYVGYLGCDEFAMLEPISEWIKSQSGPFFLTVLCSVSHDPYEVPERFGPVAKEPIERYRQTIRYTDEFAAALDELLNELGVKDNTIFCVIGDHGEAFGEHDLFGHDRIPFDEVMRIVWVMRAPGIIEEGKKAGRLVGAIDLTPTVLRLLGLETAEDAFDGIDALGLPQKERKLYFSSWLRRGPVGYIAGTQKVVYDSTNQQVFSYDLQQDPEEMQRLEITEEQAAQIIDELNNWRDGSIFQPAAARVGKKVVVFDRWQCSWNNRKAWAKYSPDLDPGRQ
jgi:lipoteichoic acid synthase